MQRVDAHDPPGNQHARKPKKPAPRTPAHGGFARRARRMAPTATGSTVPARCRPAASRAVAAARYERLDHAGPAQLAERRLILSELTATHRRVPVFEDAC